MLETAETALLLHMDLPGGRLVHAGNEGHYLPSLLKWTLGQTKQ